MKVTHSHGSIVLKPILVMEVVNYINHSSLSLLNLICLFSFYQLEAFSPKGGMCRQQSSRFLQGVPYNLQLSRKARVCRRKHQPKRAGKLEVDTKIRIVCICNAQNAKI